MKLISLDAGSRMEGTLALQMWDCVCWTHFRPAQGNLQRPNDKRHSLAHPVDLVIQHYRASFPAQLVIFEVNEVVIRSVVKGRSPQLEARFSHSPCSLRLAFSEHQLRPLNILRSMCAQQNNWLICGSGGAVTTIE